MIESNSTAPHSVGESPEGWSRDEGTYTILEHVLPGDTYTYRATEQRVMMVEYCGTT